MKKQIAHKLLFKIMNWKPADADKEPADMSALSLFGYDDYQQFEPGMRFIESLSLWLDQFPENDRKIAYDFIKNRVLYISRQQMEHTVSTVYLDFIIPELLQQVSEKCNIESWKIKKLKESIQFKILREKTLFLGLSDSSHIDEFRRSHTDINHEQVSRTHEISPDRSQKLMEKLKERLKKYKDKEYENNIFFENIFLLDDFSASGISYIRETVDGKFDGKITKFHKLIFENGVSIVKKENFHVYIILYFATKTAKDKIQTLGKKLFGENKFDVISINTFTEEIKFKESEDFTKLVINEKYGWKDIVDSSWRLGDISKPYLGFDGGSLPLVLYHNTPNNSLPIIYRDDVSKTNFQGLFRRFSRHSDYGL